MIRRLLVLLLVASILPVAAAEGSPAQRTNAPPGNSAIDEYLETVPGETGDHHHDHSDGKQGHLTQDQRRRLERLGADGRELANLVAATPVTGGSAATGHGAATGHAAAVRGEQASGSTASRHARTASTGGSRSPVHAALVAAVVTGGGGGLGLLLPIVLGASALGIIGSGVLRRRPRRG
jgi:hypothetical protein